MEIAVAVQPEPAAAALESVTTITPIWVLIDEPAEFAVAVPRSAVAGALIDSAPPVRVRVSAVPTAEAAEALTMARGAVSRETMQIKLSDFVLIMRNLESY